MAFFVFYWENLCKYCTYIVSPWQQYRKLWMQLAVLGSNCLTCYYVMLYAFFPFFLAYGEMPITLILRRSRTGTVWFYTSTSNKRAARPKLCTKSLTRDLKLMYSHLTLVRISIKLQAPCVLYIGTGVSLLFRERFLYI